MKFTELLAEHGIEFLAEGNKHCREGWVQLDCPWCGRNSRKFHMGYNLEKNYVHCWKCAKHGLVETLTELTGLSFRESRRLLGSLEAYRGPKRIEKRGKLMLPPGLGPLRRAHVEYLEGRGFNVAELERLWDIQGIGISSRLQWRVFIPIKLRGETVSWTTRAVDPNVTQRYISAGEEEEMLNHKTLLYGEDLAKHAICVVEGPMDVWKIGPGAVATFGTAIKQAQLLRMSRYPIVGICYDNETVAQSRARQMAEDLKSFGGRVCLLHLDAKDAGEASEKELRSIRKELGL